MSVFQVSDWCSAPRSELARASDWCLCCAQQEQEQSRCACLFAADSPDGKQLSICTWVPNLGRRLLRTYLPLVAESSHQRQTPTTIRVGLQNRPRQTLTLFYFPQPTVLLPCDSFLGGISCPCPSFCTCVWGIWDTNSNVGGHSLVLFSSCSPAVISFTATVLIGPTPPCLEALECPSVSSAASKRSSAEDPPTLSISSPSTCT